MTLRKDRAVEDNKMKMNIKALAVIIILLMTSVIKSNAQNFIAAKTFVKNKTVYLRCVPNNISTLDYCKEKGFIIKRIVWESNTLPDSTNFRTSSSLFYIKPFNKENKEWDTLSGSSPEAAFLYSILYEPGNSTNVNMNMAFGLAILSCDFDVDLAKAAGLFYVDENLPKGKYAYLIQATENKPGVKIKPAIVIVNTAINDQLQNIDSLKIKTKRKEVNLTWAVEKLKSDYTGYFIERSEDGKNFSVLNKKPHIQVQTQYEKNKKDISYNDTITEYGKTYYYRVRGLGFFGIHGNYSNIVKCKSIKPLDASPQADSTNLLYDSVLQVNWHMPKSFNLNELKAFDIYRSKTNDGVYKKLNKNPLLKETTSFIDYFPNQSNFYKVLAYSTSSDSAYSHPLMGLIPDIHPPKTPIGLKGKVDTTGIVILTWLPNKENDLKGYRIFRNNAMDEELVEITKLIFKDTIYKDTITLETLTEEVYYSITAVDMVYNNSPYASPVKLKRPDKIKPVPAQFTEVIHTDTTIIAKWICSTSKDAERYELWRSIKNNDFEKIKEWKVTDSLIQFTDAHLEYGMYYQYQLKVIDDDGNVSITNSAAHYFDARIRKPIKLINYNVNLEKKNITLTWEYPEKELYSFIIYKAKKGEPLKIIKTIKGNIFTFEDAKLNIGNQYEYRIKANFNTGAESYISEPVMVEF